MATPNSEGEGGRSSYINIEAPRRRNKQIKRLKNNIGSEMIQGSHEYGHGAAVVFHSQDNSKCGNANLLVFIK